MVTCNFVVYKPYYNSFAVEWSNAIKVYTSEWRDDCTNFIEYTIYDNKWKKQLYFAEHRHYFSNIFHWNNPIWMPNFNALLDRL